LPRKQRHKPEKQKCFFLANSPGPGRNRELSFSQRKMRLYGSRVHLVSARTLCVLSLHSSYESQLENKLSFCRTTETRHFGYTHKNTYIHIYIHMRAHTHARAHTRARTHTCTHKHARKYTSTQKIGSVYFECALCFILETTPSAPTRARTHTLFLLPLFPFVFFNALLYSLLISIH